MAGLRVYLPIQPYKIYRSVGVWCLSRIARASDQYKQLLARADASREGKLDGRGLLSESSSRSPLRWEIPEHAEPWYFPNLTPGVV